MPVALQEGNEMNESKISVRKFEEVIASSIKGRELNSLEEFIASLLFGTTAARPLKAEEISTLVRMNLSRPLGRRRLKVIIRKFRREYGFPILTRRKHPAGYWWCQSEVELLEFERMWKSQIKDESITLAKMRRWFYRENSGQERLEGLGE